MIDGVITLFCFEAHIIQLYSYMVRGRITKKEARRLSATCDRCARVFLFLRLAVFLNDSLHGTAVDPYIYFKTMGYVRQRLHNKSIPTPLPSSW